MRKKEIKETQQQQQKSVCNRTLGFRRFARFDIWNFCHESTAKRFVFFLFVNFYISRSILDSGFFSIINIHSIAHFPSAMRMMQPIQWCTHTYWKMVYGVIRQCLMKILNWCAKIVRIFIVLSDNDRYVFRCFPFQPFDASFLLFLGYIYILHFDIHLVKNFFFCFSFLMREKSHFSSFHRRMVVHKFQCFFLFSLFHSLSLISHSFTSWKLILALHHTLCDSNIDIVESAHKETDWHSQELLR